MKVGVRGRLVRPLACDIKGRVAPLVDGRGVGSGLLDQEGCHLDRADPGGHVQGSRTIALADAALGAWDGVAVAAKGTM